MYLSSKEDYFNSKRTRNQDNTEQETYNCGGYALNTFSWFFPDEKFLEYPTDFIPRDIIIRESWQDSDDEITQYILNRDVEYMLSVFSNLTLYTGDPTTYTQKENEELIAYRIFIDREFDDDDFHFKVFRDGTWKEKCGADQISFCEPPWLESSWEYSTGTYYNSDTIYFILKK